MAKTFFKSFSERPSMYLGETSLKLLRVFINAIHMTENLHDIPTNKSLLPGDLGEFENWLARHNKNYCGATLSYGLAMRKSQNNDKEAFNLWMKWYNEFVESEK